MSYVYEKFDFSLFSSRFRDYERMDQFSMQGLRGLYNHLTELAEDTNEPVEFDCIALCCDYAEDTLDNLKRFYDLESLEDLQQNTWAIELDNGNILYQNY